MLEVVIMYVYRTNRALDLVLLCAVEWYICNVIYIMIELYRLRTERACNDNEPTSYLRYIWSAKINQNVDLI